MINQNRIDIMTDIETLGNKSDSTIIQLSAVPFNISTGEVFSEDIFSMTADISLNEERVNVTGSTIKWWLDTNTDLFKELLNLGSLSSEDVLREFHEWVVKMKSIVGENHVYLWGNGILFDNKMIQHQMENLGLDYPIFYRNDRDVRTIVENATTKLDVEEREFKKSIQEKMDSFTAHNALDDCMFQVELVSICWKELMKK